MTGSGIQAAGQESPAAELSGLAVLTLSPNGHSPHPVWASASAPLPCFSFCGRPGVPGLGLRPCPYPSCPKVMFSLKRRLSSRSSCVMWHHFSLQAQGAGGRSERHCAWPLPPLLYPTGQWYPRRASPHRKPISVPTLPEGPPLTNVALPKMRGAQSSDTSTGGRGRVPGGSSAILQELRMPPLCPALWLEDGRSPHGSGRPAPAKRLSGLSGLGGSGPRGGDGLLWAAMPEAQGAGGWRALPPSLSGQAAWVLWSRSPCGCLSTPSWVHGPDSGPPRRPQ